MSRDLAGGSVGSAHRLEGGRRGPAAEMLAADVVDRVGPSSLPLVPGGVGAAFQLEFIASPPWRRVLFAGMAPGDWRLSLV